MNEINESVIRAFKKAIFSEMGKTNSNEFGLKTLPIAWETAIALKWDPRKFCLRIGFSEFLLDQKGYITKPDCTCGHPYREHADGSVVGLGLACVAPIKVGDDQFLRCDCDDYRILDGAYDEPRTPATNQTT